MSASASESGQVATGPAPQARRPRADAVSAQGAGRRRSDWWVPTAVALSLLIGTWFMAADGWASVGDVALMELRLQAMPEDMPLVGVYSRFGWWHPGPAFLLWSWVGYTLGGASGAALLMTMAVLHVAVLLCAWWLCRQVNVVAAHALLLAAVASMLVRPSDQVVIPWNPYVGIAGVLLLVAAGWGLALRKPAAAFVLLPWASFLVQSHVGYVPVVGAVVATAVGLLVLDSVWRRWRGSAAGQSRAIPWRWLIGGAVVSALMWLPPVFQQITGEPGNLGLLVGQLGGDSQGMQAGLATMRAAFSVPMQLGPDFAGQLPANDAGTPWLLLFPAAALLVAMVRRRREQIFAVVFLAAVLVAALVSVAGLAPPAFEYLVPWLPSVVLLTLAWSGWVLLDPLLGTRRWWSAVVGVATVITAVVVAVGLGTAQPPLASYSLAVGQLWPAVAADAAAVAAGGPVAEEVPTTAPITLVAADGDEPAQAVAQGMAAMAVPAGADVAVDADLAARVEFVVPADGPGRIRYVVRSYTPGEPTPAGQRVLAVYDPFTAEQWAELTRLDAALADTNRDTLTRLALATQRAELAQGRSAFQVLAPVG